MPITINGSGTITGISAGGLPDGIITAADIASGQVFSLNGVQFPASQVASADANTLDDYEEGTFTPTLSSGFSVAPTSYTNQLGRYTKIGRVVYFEIDIDPNGATGNATQISFGGLPFTSAAGPYGGVIVGYNGGFNTNAGDTYIVGESSTRIDINTNVPAGRNGNSAGVNINSRIILSGCYTAA